MSDANCVFFGVLALITVGFIVASIRLLRAEERRHRQLMEGSEASIRRSQQARAMLSPLPEEMFLVLTPSGDEEYPVYVCYTEAEALRLAASHNPGGRVRLISVWDASRVEEGTTTPGPVGG